MIRLTLIALGAAFLFLVLAGSLPPPWWVASLHGLALAVAVAGLSALAAGAGRLPWKEPGRSLALPVAAAAAALASRGWLVSWLVPDEAVPRIDFARIQLAAIAVVASVVALVSAIAVVARSGHPASIAAAVAAVAAALFVLGPLLLRAGLPLDHRTFLGLAGLGVSAYVVVEARRRVREKRER